MKTHGSCIFSRKIDELVCICKIKNHERKPQEYGCGMHLEGKTYEEKNTSVDPPILEDPAKKKQKIHQDKQHDIPDYFDEM